MGSSRSSEGRTIEEEFSEMSLESQKRKKSSLVEDKKGKDREAKKRKIVKKKVEQSQKKAEAPRAEVEEEIEREKLVKEEEKWKTIVSEEEEILYWEIRRAPTPDDKKDP